VRCGFEFLSGFLENAIDMYNENESMTIKAVKFI